MCQGKECSVKNFAPLNVALRAQMGEILLIRNQKHLQSKKFNILEANKLYFF